MLLLFFFQSTNRKLIKTFIDLEITWEPAKPVKPPKIEHYVILLRFPRTFPQVNETPAQKG